MNITIGNVLIHLRKEHKLTQKQVADLLDVSRQTYSAWERNCNDMALSKFLKLSSVYNIPVLDLLKIIEKENPMIIT